MGNRSVAFVFLVVLGAAGLGGCRGTSAQPAPAHSSQLAETLGRPRAAAWRLSKRLLTSGSTSVYTNSTYGLVLHFPRSYALQDDPEADLPEFARTQLQFDSEQPGAVLLATLQIPDDAFPNSPFIGGFLQLVVNPGLTPRSCSHVLDPASQVPSGRTGSTKIQGIAFEWKERTFSYADTEFRERTYVGSANGECYEFFGEVSATASETYSVASSLAETEKTLRHLDNVILSSEFSAGQILPIAAAPVLREFRVDTVSYPGLNNVFRISWEVHGAIDNQVFLSVDCCDGLTTYRLSAPDAAKSEIACGAFLPLSGETGTVDLQFENLLGADANVAFTLFVPHLDAIKRTVTVASKD